MGTKLAILFLGLAFTYVGFAYSSLARRMRTFKSVTGRVIARAVVVTGSRAAGKFGDGGNYAPQVTYRYVVDGVELESNKMGASLDGFKRAIAERKLAEIPNEVVVWYNAKKPSEAYLRKHGPALGYAILVLGACIALGAITALLS